MSYIPENPSKLEKLKITAYAKPARNKVDQLGNAFDAMFNPESYRQTYGIQYGKKVGINSSETRLDYAYNDQQELAFTLIFDSSPLGEDFGLENIGNPKKDHSVAQRFKEFLDLAYHIDGDLHEPRYLKVNWGDLDFPCRLKSAEITYTSFGRDGKPNRAQVDILLASDRPASDQMKSVQKNSPDLTHTWIVREGDTLPYLCQKIYGSPHYYLQVAAINNLTNFRQLQVGRELVFPPVEK